MYQGLFQDPEIYIQYIPKEYFPKYRMGKTVKSFTQLVVLISYSTPVLKSPILGHLSGSIV